MKRVLFLSCAALVVSAGLIYSAEAAETTAAEDAVRKSAQEFVAAFDQGNAEAIAAQWTPDGEYTIGRQSLKGREAIARTYGEFLRAHPRSKMNVKIESIRVLAPTVAIEQGTASTEGQGGLRSESAYTAVHVKQANGKWLMASVRESEMPSVTATDELNDIAWLVGAWAANGDASKVEMNYEWMADKHFLKGQTTITTPDGSKSGGTQIIGKDPQSGRLISWFFNPDGSHGQGVWSQEGSRWIINTEGTSADGASDLQPRTSSTTPMTTSAHGNRSTAQSAKYDCRMPRKL